jgi:hypothetical protein
LIASPVIFSLQITTISSEKLNLFKNELPSGSGFDSGTKFDFERSYKSALVFNTGYHCMNENGMYDGWIDFDIIIVPDFGLGFNIAFKGQSKNAAYKKYWNQISEYIAECFDYDFNKEINL